MESLKGTSLRHLSAKDVLQLLITAKITDNIESRSLWANLLDSNEDVLDASPLSEINLFNDRSYSFSMRSPHVLNSTILCFGKELGVPNLMQCMLDSHWKLSDKMVKLISKPTDSPQLRRQNYLVVMEGLMFNYIRDIGRDYIFTRNTLVASLDNKYRFYPTSTKEMSSIKRKLLPGENLTPDERAREKAEIIKNGEEVDVVCLMRYASSQDLAAEFIAFNPQLFPSAIEECVYARYPHARSILEKILSLDIPNTLQGNAFNDVLIKLNYFDEKKEQTF